MRQIVTFFVQLPEWLKWAVVVFLAGAVGQFGKSLTLYIIGRIKNKKKTDSSSVPGRVLTGNAEEDYKLKKKELKALAKLEKKKAKAREKENK